MSGYTPSRVEVIDTTDRSEDEFYQFKAYMDVMHIDWMWVGCRSVRLIRLEYPVSSAYKTDKGINAVRTASC